MEEKVIDIIEIEFGTFTIYNNGTLRNDEQTVVITDVTNTGDNYVGLMKKIEERLETEQEIKMTMQELMEQE